MDPLARLFEELKTHRTELEAQNEELRMAHRELEEGLVRFAQLFQFAPIGYVRLTADGFVAELNDTGEAILREPRRKIVDRRFALFVAQSERMAFHTFFESVQSSEDKKTAEFELETTDGAKRYARFTATRLADSRPTVLLAFEDITAEKRADELARASERAKIAERELREADRRKDEFLASLSHELRTPLTAILMHAQLLLRNEDPTVKKSSATIERAALAQTRLIEDLLDVSRIVAGKLTFEKRPSSLATVVQEAIRSVELDAGKKRITLASTTRTAIRPLFVDPIRLQQAVWNLLSNAIKFTPEGGRVDVEVGAADSEAYVLVQDTGRGIEPAFLPHVFEKFRQSNSSVTRAAAGLGLGLSIAKALVEHHGGTIRAQSRGAGQGSTFVIALPLTKSFWDEESAKSDDVASADVKLDQSRILIVEDDVDTRDTMIHVLTLAGAEVRGVSDAEDAWKTLERFEPDLVVSDIAMPSEDGYSLLRRMRERWPERRTRAVAVTALASAEDRARAADAGFDQHVAKPIDVNGFLKIVSRLAGRPASTEALTP